MGCVKSEPEADEVGEKKGPRKREMREVHDEREDRGKDGEVKVFADEGGVVREEGGVEGELNAGDVETAVLCEGMVAVDEESDEGQGGKQ